MVTDATAATATNIVAASEYVFTARTAKAFMPSE